LDRIPTDNGGYRRVGALRSTGEWGRCDGHNFKSPGLSALVRSLPECPFNNKHAPVMLRHTVEADGRVSKAEVIQPSALKSWDKEAVRRARAAKFPEAIPCNGLTIDMWIQYHPVLGKD